jgi:hypothetical protein
MNAPMITKNQANRSITQLLCLILGGEKSKASAHFASDPLKRIEFCFKLVQQEMAHAKSMEDPIYSAGKRHVDSLESLKKLALLVREVEW